MAGLPSIFPLVWRIVSFFDSTFGGSFAPSALRASASRRRFTKAPAFVKLFCRLCRPNPAPIKSEIKSNGEINTSTVFCIGYVARRRRNRNPKAGAFVQRLRRFVCAFGGSFAPSALHASASRRRFTKAPAFVKLFRRLCRQYIHRKQMVLIYLPGGFSKIITLG
jgi:hypothetical protein